MINLKAITKNKYGSNFIWTFCEKLINLTSVLVVGVFLARYLGPEKFGILTYSQSYVGMFAFLIGLGLDNITIREVVKKAEESDRIISTSFVLKMSAFIVVMLIVNLIGYFSNEDLEIRLIILVASLGLIQHPFNVFVNYFQAVVNIRYISLMIMISRLLLIISKLLMIVYKASLISFVVVDVIVLILLSLSYFFYYKNYLSLKFNKLFLFSREIAYIMLKDSWPLMISSGAIMLYMRLDQIMIKEMLTLEELGLYSVGVRISESWYFIPMIISSVLFPSIIKAKEQELKLYYDRLKQLFALSIWVALALSLILFVFSEMIIENLFGESYIGAHIVLSILSCAGVFVSMGYVNGKWMVVENYTRLSLLRNIIGLIINVLCNVVLIPMYGIKGAAISTLLAIFVASNLFFFFSGKTRRIFFIQNLSIFHFNGFKK